VQIQRLQDRVVPQSNQLSVDRRSEVVGAGHVTADRKAVRGGVQERLGGVQVTRPPRRHVLGRRRVDDHGEAAVPANAVEALGQPVDERRRPEGAEAGPGGAVERVVGGGQLVVSDAAAQQSELVVGSLYQFTGTRYSTTTLIVG